MSNSENVYARVRKGAPMPAAMQPYVNSHAFYNFRDRCCDAPTRDAFMEIVRHFNEENQLAGAVQGYQEDNRLVTFFKLLIFASLSKNSPPTFTVMVKLLLPTLTHFWDYLQEVCHCYTYRL